MRVGVGGGVVVGVGAVVVVVLCMSVCVSLCAVWLFVKFQVQSSLRAP